MPPHPLIPPASSSREPAATRALPPSVGEALLQGIAQADPGALESLYQLCGDRFYSMARHIVQDDGAAREITQDCFVRIWQRAATYDPAAASPFTWCVMLLRGLCLDHLRRIGRRLPAASVESPPEISCPKPPLADLHLHETLQVVRKGLATLTPQEQEAIHAALFDPATCSDLATRWGIPMGSVKTRIHRAMEKLRAFVRPHLH